MIMRHWYLYISRSGLCFFGFIILATAAPKEKAGINESLYLEAKHCGEKAISYFAAKQNAEGYWSQKDYPALTGLVLRCFFFAPKLGVDIQPYDTTVKKGLRYLEQCFQKDGGIYLKGFENYCTAICMTTLIASGDAKYDSIIIKANNFLVGGQMNSAKEADKNFNGGLGYNKSGHSDFNNTTYALEALYLAKKMFAPDKKAPVEQGQNPQSPRIETTRLQELNWDAAIGFISRCQNLPETNKLEWASADSVNKGGFVYYPGDSKAGVDSSDGQIIYKSYGTASLGGLVSLLFANVDKNDVRIKAVYSWIQKNYTVEENPGLGQEGLYFYYYIMAKALRFYGSDYLDGKGNKIAWRKELIQKIINLQNNEGFWVNNTGRWWENDPILATSYTLQALEMTVP